MNKVNQQKVAIFDIDGTIFRSSLLIEATEALSHAGVFPKEASKTYQEPYENWLDRKKPYNEYLAAVVEAYEANIVGVSQDDYNKVTRRVIEYRKNRVYCFTRDLVKKLKQKGYYLLAISGSPTDLVEEFGHNLGFNKVYGRIYEITDGKFTGRILHEELITDKAKILKRAVEKENLTLDDSFAVGDTEADIAMLSHVDNPICFNPSKNLYDHAKTTGWRVVVERKDVIYHIQ